MKKGICRALAAYGRISLVIQKCDKDYAKFAQVLNAIEKQGCMSWYGDVTDESGKETSGLIITSGESGCRLKSNKPVCNRI